jgi:alpha-L-fucosidase 2
MGCTHDRVVIFALFTDCIQASKVLGIDSDFAGQLEIARSKLPPFQIGKYGQLQEWLKDYDEAIPNHRHTSHLLGLYPFDQISPRTTPALANAVRVALERRMKRKNWEDVEWSRANAINYYARLHDGTDAEQSLAMLIGSLCDENLFTFSPRGIAGAPDNVFAVDGNEAGTAGIAEMLLQSQGGELVFLPALPPIWPSGSVRGLCARGGYQVDESWSTGVLSTAIVHCACSGVCRVRSTIPLRVESQGKLIPSRHPQADLIDVDCVAGQTLEFISP